MVFAWRHSDMPQLLLMIPLCPGISWMLNKRAVFFLPPCVMHFCEGDLELCFLLQIVALMLGVLTTVDFVASKPQSSPANTYLPPDQGYQYQRPSVPFPSPVPGPSGPLPTYPRPSPGPLRPSPTPTYGTPPSVPQGPPRPPPTYGGGQVSIHSRATWKWLHATRTSPLFLVMSLRTDITL
jgi:hypothetical protein